MPPCSCSYLLAAWSVSLTSAIIWLFLCLLAGPSLSDFANPNPFLQSHCSLFARQVANNYLSCCQAPLMEFICYVEAK